MRFLAFPFGPTKERVPPRKYISQSIRRIRIQVCLPFVSSHACNSPLPSDTVSCCDRADSDTELTHIVNSVWFINSVVNHACVPGLVDQSHLFSSKCRKQEVLRAQTVLYEGHKTNSSLFEFRLTRMNSDQKSFPFLFRSHFIVSMSRTSFSVRAGARLFRAFLFSAP